MWPFRRKRPSYKDVVSDERHRESRNLLFGFEQALFAYLAEKESFPYLGMTAAGSDVLHSLEERTRTMPSLVTQSFDEIPQMTLFRKTAGYRQELIWNPLTDFPLWMQCTVYTQDDLHSFMFAYLAEKGIIPEEPAVDGKLVSLVRGERLQLEAVRSYFPKVTVSTNLFYQGAVTFSSPEKSIHIYIGDKVVTTVEKPFSLRLRPLG